MSGECASQRTVSDPTAQRAEISCWSFSTGNNSKMIRGGSAIAAPGDRGDFRKHKAAAASASCKLYFPRRTVARGAVSRHYADCSVLKIRSFMQRHLLVLAAAICIPCTLSAQRPIAWQPPPGHVTLNLWPHGAPGSPGDAG